MVLILDKNFALKLKIHKDQIFERDPEYLKCHLTNKFKNLPLFVFYCKFNF
jgi:hypothetical protein